MALDVLSRDVLSYIQVKFLKTSLGLYRTTKLMIPYMANKPIYKVKSLKKASAQEAQG